MPVNLGYQPSEAGTARVLLYADALQRKEGRSRKKGIDANATPLLYEEEYA